MTSKTNVVTMQYTEDKEKTRSPQQLSCDEGGELSCGFYTLRHNFACPALHMPHQEGAGFARQRMPSRRCNLMGMPFKHNTVNRGQGHIEEGGEQVKAFFLPQTHTFLL